MIACSSRSVIPPGTRTRRQMAGLMPTSVSLSVTTTLATLPRTRAPPGEGTSAVDVHFGKRPQQDHAGLPRPGRLSQHLIEAGGQTYSDRAAPHSAAALYPSP